VKAERPGVEPRPFESRVQRPNHHTTKGAPLRPLGACVVAMLKAVERESADLPGVSEGPTPVRSTTDGTRWKPQLAVHRSLEATPCLRSPRPLSWFDWHSTWSTNELLIPHRRSFRLYRN